MNLRDMIIKSWKCCEKEILKFLEEVQAHKMMYEYTIKYLNSYKYNKWTAFDLLAKNNELTDNLINQIDLNDDVIFSKFKKRVWDEFIELIYWPSQIRLRFPSKIEKELTKDIYVLEFNEANVKKIHDLFRQHSLNLFEEQIQIIFGHFKKYSSNSKDVEDFRSEFHFPIKNKESLDPDIGIMIRELAGFACILGLYPDFNDGPTHMGYFINALVSYRDNEWESVYIGSDAIQTLVDPQQTVLKVRFSEEMARALNQFI